MEEYGEYVDRKRKRGLKEKNSLPFNYNDPECILFCNSKFDQIKEWLQTTARPFLEKHPQANTDIQSPKLLLDLSFCRAKLFMALIHKLPQMFP